MNTERIKAHLLYIHIAIVIWGGQVDWGDMRYSWNLHFFCPSVSLHPILDFFHGMTAIKALAHVSNNACQCRGTKSGCRELGVELDLRVAFRLGDLAQVEQEAGDQNGLQAVRRLINLIIQCQ